MEFLTKHKKIFIICMVILCLLTIVFTLKPSYVTYAARNAAGVVINPINGALSAAGGWVSGRVGFLTQMNALNDKVKELEDENSRLTIENIRLKEAQKENDKLSKLLEIVNQYADYPMVGAKIISKDSSDWYDSYKINKGAKDGIKENMVALAPGGLMGKVIECNYFDSTVISLIDDRSSIAAQCSRTGDMGFVKGSSELMRQGLCIMEYVDIDAQILPGDEIITSQLSAFFPPGIIIGRVKDVMTDTNGLTKRAVIEPSVSLTRLDTLLIITQQFSAEGN